MMVLAHHYFGFEAGFSGVTFFYVLSGYILTINYADKVGSWSAIRAFWWKRFARIYPTHLLTLIITLPLWSGWIPFAFNLLLLQTWVPSQDIYLSFNGPSWSISNEAAFYAAFPVLLALVTPRNLLIAALAVVALAASISVMHPEWTLLSPAVHYLFYVFPPVRAFEFALGIAIAKFAKRGAVGTSTEVLAIAFAALCVAAYYLRPPAPFSAALIFIPGAAAMVFAFSRGTGILSQVLSMQVLVVLGDASFMLYMIHFPLHAGLHINPYALTAIAVGLSVAMHFTYEMPAKRFLLSRNRLHHRKADRDRLAERAGGDVADHDRG